MALKISEQVEEMVKADRADGMTYDALVEKYKEHGVTKNWVRRVCKGIKPKKIKTNVQKAVDAVYQLAVRPIGVKPSEYFPILRECYGLVYDAKAGYEKLNVTAGQRSYLRSQVKEKAKKEGKEAHFIPEWMDRVQPRLCNKVMLECAQSLYESFEEQVAYFLEMFPELNEGKGAGYSIRNELFSLVVQGYDPSGVHNRCERNLEAVGFLTGDHDIPLTSYSDMAKEYQEYQEERNVHGDTQESIDEWEQTFKELGY